MTQTLVRHLPFRRLLMFWAPLVVVGFAAAAAMWWPPSVPRVTSGQSILPTAPWSAGLSTIPLAIATPHADDREQKRSVVDYTLRVQRTRVPFSGAAEHGGPKEVELLTYNGRLVGPTIRARRGDTLRIKVINELPLAGQPQLVADRNQEDPPHDLYTTNLHTHGLHVSPEGASDNVFREIPPGASFRYTITIPADHPSGTYWYHPHKHGSLSYQLGNGLAGALIIDGGGSPGPVRDLDDIPEIARAKEQILVLQDLVLRIDAHHVGRVDPRDSYEAPPPEAYSVTAVNGAVMPSYTMQPEEVQRWRLIRAGREGPLTLCWFSDRDMRINMNFHQIALDGLAIGRIVTCGEFDLYPGQRSDILVKAPARTGTYFLAAVQEDESPGATKKPTVNYLAKLVVQGPVRRMDLPTAAELAPCKPLESIEPAECRIKRDFVFSFDEQKKTYHINGISFSQQTAPDRILLGSAEQWTLSAQDPPPGTDNEPHPFHLHTNSFEVVQIEDLRTHRVKKVDEWRDTFAVEPGKRVTVRIRFRDFPGKMVFHCHTLDHGDQGMMRAIRIVDPRRSSAGADEPSAKLADCRIPAPPLILPTPEGPLWDLKSARGRNVILVFFRGASCSHCIAQLRQLVAEARLLAGADTAIVAVSCWPIDDPVELRQALEVPAGLDFRLLVDEQYVGFRAFGCYDDDRPQHGLFIIDQTGAILARYTGEVPLADTPAIWARLGPLRSPASSAGL